MYTEFATWGDIKALIQRTKGEDRFTQSQIFSINVLHEAQSKSDDEFFFTLTESAIITARLERWPLSRRLDDAAIYEVCLNLSGTITLLLNVDGERYYFRNNGHWVYIGPGDPSNHLLEGPRYRAKEAIVDAYDIYTKREDKTTYSDFAVHIPKVHEMYLADGRLSYYSYTHSKRQAAYMLVTMFAPDDDSSPEPTLFLITDEYWFYRRAGAWHDMDWDQIVGDDGEFHGLLISRMLEVAAVEAWDGADLPRDLSDAAVYCAAFPTFRFEDCGHEQTRLLCDTENATWEANEGGWTLLRKGPPRSVAKQLSIESFTLGSWERNGAVSPIGFGDKRVGLDTERLDGAVELGLLTLINPTLIAEAHKWFFALPDTPGRLTHSYRSVNKFLLSVASPRMCTTGDHCTALQIVNGDTLWERADGNWVLCDVAKKEDLFEQNFLPVDSCRLPELTAWWDSRAEASRQIQNLPGNYNFVGALECPGGFDVDCIYVKDAFRVIDGTRSWYRSNGQWEVGGWVNNLEDEEPDAEERLPDWFYNV